MFRKSKDQNTKKEFTTATHPPKVTIMHVHIPQEKEMKGG